MILQYYGTSVRLSHLRMRFPVNSEYGLTLFDLKYISAENGLTSRGIQFELNDLSSLKAPCILHWGNNHFVVLHKVTRKSVIIIDPASGWREVSLKYAKSKLTGFALEITEANPDIIDSVAGQDKINLRILRKYLPNYFRHIGFAFIVGFIVEVIALVTPIYVQIAIDELTSTLNLDFVLSIGLVFLAVHLFEALYTFVRTRISVNAQHSLTLHFTDSLVARLIQLPDAFFRNRNTGDLLARIESASAVSAFLTTSVISASVGIVAAMVTLIFMFIVNAYMALLSIAVLVLIAILRFLVFKPMLRALNEQLTYNGRANGVLVESLESIHSLRFGGYTDSRFSKWQREFAQSTNHSMKGMQYRAFYDATAGLFVNIERIVIVTFACYLVLQGEITIGVLYTYIIYKALFSRHIMTIMDVWMERSLLRSHLDRLEDIALSDTAARKTRISGTELSLLTKPFSVSVKNVTWKPQSTHEPIIKDICLELGPEQIAVIHGASGSGKSSLLGMLYGRIETEENQIFFNDVDIAKISLNDLITLVSTVTPEDRLLSGTVLQNISGDLTDVNLSRAKLAAKQAGIDKKIDNFSNGYHTFIQHHSSFISTGERLRLLLARALYKPSSLLILDEFAASLDDQLAIEVWERIFETQDRTIIIATHKPTLLTGTGKHYKMTDGRLALYEPNE